MKRWFLAFLFGCTMALNVIGEVYMDIEKVKQKVEKKRDSVTKKDLEELEQAAVKGDYDAACVLATFYIEGNNDISYNDKLAVKWMTYSAENGYPPAMITLYDFYRGKYSFLKNVKVDMQKAWKWLNKCNETGFVVAKRELGNCYRNSIIVDKDLEKAFSYYTAAMKECDIPSMLVAAEMIDNGEGCNKSERAAFDLYKIIAEQANNAEAQNVLGYKYYFGIGTKKDWKRAYEWWMKSAKQGFPEAMQHLATMYMYGQYVEQDDKQAFAWTKKAANLGNAVAQYHMGLVYLHGAYEGVKVDYKKALDWLTKAAEQGVSLAKCDLGVMYRDGEGVKRDYKKAAKWLLEAAEEGDALAQFHIGNMYIEGIGVKTDLAKALEWMEKAYKNGVSVAGRCVIVLKRVTGQKLTLWETIKSIFY